MKTLLFLLLPLFSFSQSLITSDIRDSITVEFVVFDTLHIQIDTIPTIFLVSDVEPFQSQYNGIMRSEVFLLHGYVLLNRGGWYRSIQRVDHLFQPLDNRFKVWITSNSLTQGVWPK